MSASDKATNTGDKIKGKAKEAAGKLTRDKELEREGKADQIAGDAKQAGEKVKDTFRH
ncbi:CsbD family protein [Streptomyces sp. NPDC003077]|uniref:CsbD family protein n=1 Tax=Streptomyces sp. NPDC003077 TaxID=3154443 RepID=UPI0033BA7876